MQLLFIHPKISTHPTGKGKWLKAERKQMTQAAVFRWGFHTLHKLLLLCQNHMSQQQEARAASAPVLGLCYGTSWLLRETSHRDRLGVSLCAWIQPRIQTSPNQQHRSRTLREPSCL